VAPYMQTIAVLPLRLQGLLQFGSAQKVSVLKTPIQSCGLMSVFSLSVVNRKVVKLPHVIVPSKHPTVS